VRQIGFQRLAIMGCRLDLPAEIIADTALKFLRDVVSRRQRHVAVIFEVDVRSACRRDRARDMMNRRRNEGDHMMRSRKLYCREPDGTERCIKVRSAIAERLADGSCGRSLILSTRPIGG